MKKYIKITCHILFFCIILTFKAFPLAVSHVDIYDSPYSTSYISASNDITFNQYMKLKDVRVSFSQDDDKYTFKVSANSSVKIYDNLFKVEAYSCSGSLVPLLYKEENFGDGMKITESTKLPHSDCYNVDCYTTAEVKIKNKTQSKYVNKYHLNYSEHITTESIDTNNGEKYFIPKSLRNSISSGWGFNNTTKYPIYCTNNGDGVSLVRNSSYNNYTYINSCYDTYFAYMDVTISINKNYIDDYRYLCFAQECIAESYGEYNDRHYNFYGVSVCSNTIDLKEYVDCDHNWTYKIKDKLSHVMYCDKCKWEKEEPHWLLYEYDGIEYDVCTCSYVDKVKYRFVINDDITGEVEEVCDTECEYNKHKFMHKKGYNFKWYEKYILKHEHDKELSKENIGIYYDFIATVSEMDKVAGKKSVLYEAKYSPIKYVFNYSNYNTCDLKLDNVISKQEVYYDERACLKKSIDVNGYEFKGWALDKKSKKIDFIELEDVTNYTTENLKEYTLYPVYERMDYTLVYNAGNYTFENGEKEKTVKYSYFDNGELEKPKINSSNYVFSGYVDTNGNKYNTLSDVRNVIDKIKKSNMILHLKVSVGSIGIGGAESTKKGRSSTEPTTENKYLSNIETSSSTDLYETTEIVDYSVPYNYLYETRTNNIIKGMSNTNEEIVDEEVDADLDKPRVATISLINKFKFNDEKLKKSKLDLLREFIENNKILCIIAGTLLFLLLMFYEIFVIRHYIKRKSERLA